MGLPQPWKEFPTLNCVNIADQSVKELKCSTLNACLNKIWPKATLNQNSINPVNKELNCIINVAHTLDGKGYCDMFEQEILELLKQTLNYWNPWIIENKTDLNEDELV